MTITNTEEEGLTASAMPWDPSQPTWTPTGQTTHSPETENNTVTPSPTSDGSTATKTPTGKPTKTKKPGTATPTYTATRYNWTAPSSTPQPPGNNPVPVDAGATAAAQTAEVNQSGVTQAVQPTDTLVPLPSVTIVFQLPLLNSRM